MRTFKTPEPLRVDAYQAGHHLLVPQGMRDFQCSQGIFRKPLHYDGDADNRIVAAGLAPFVHLNLHTPITETDIREADDFYGDFHAHTEPPFSKPYPYPKKMFQRVINEFGGYLPICVTGLIDGTTHYVGEPHVQVWTDVPGMGELVGWIESSLAPYLWTMSTVATRGRIRKDKFQKLFAKCYPSASADEVDAMIAYKFHDFGRRGAACSQMTGIAHLLNWLGTDTMDAAYAATMMLNDGKKFGACSIMAAAHRTITPWEDERTAYEREIEECKDGIFAIVADSYDYFKGVEILSDYANVIKEADGLLVVRPDSGDPVECVVRGLQILEKTFGSSKQEVGLKVLNNAAIIQGDGVSDSVIFNDIYPAVIAAGYCPSNVGFGMGEYNHRCVRSDMEWAYKTCMIGNSDGIQTGKWGNPWLSMYPDHTPTMKGSNSQFKKSLPCPVKINSLRVENRVSPIDINSLSQGHSGDLFVQYDGRAILKPEVPTFDLMRELANSTWDRLPPVVGDTFSGAIREMQDDYLYTQNMKLERDNDGTRSSEG